MAKRPDRPAYEKRVDRDLAQYARCRLAIAHQSANLELYRSLGTRITTSYENDGGKGGPVTWKDEEVVIRILEAERIIQHCADYCNAIDAVIRRVFQGQDDKQMFINIYWLWNPGTKVKWRIDKVLIEMPYLGYIDKKYRRKRDRFYDWRNQIYRELAQAFGYL